MAPPVAVYVVAAVVGVAAVFAFKEFVYEPHIAPKLEEWAEEFLARRRAARDRQASTVPVGSTRRRRDTSPSSDASHHDHGHPRDGAENDGALDPNTFSADSFELEALASREVDEWRNEVLRSQDHTRDGLRRRRLGPFKDDFDGFETTSTTLDESFTSLTYTPLASTHVISNLSSPSTASVPLTPTGRLRSESQSTTTQRDANTPLAPFSSMPEISVMPPVIVSSGPSSLPLTDGGIASPPPITIPNAIHRSSVIEGVTHPLFLSPTSEAVGDDSPFGPLLPDTPRSSAEIYGQRPFSPITRVMGSSSSYGSRGTLSSRANSTSSLRTVGGSGVFRRSSGLANEVVAGESDDDLDPPHASTSTFTPISVSAGSNASIISSLSERYPAPPTPPVIVSPPASSVDIISPPSSPGSGDSEVVVHHHPLAAGLHSSSIASLATSNPPLLQIPSDSSNGRPISAVSTSPALSFVSFLSPMPISRAASESETDEFMSVASDDNLSDNGWGITPALAAGRTGPVRDRPHNPFLDFEYEQADGSEEGSEVLVSEGHEGASEMGSDESWGEIGR